MEAKQSRVRLSDTTVGKESRGSSRCYNIVWTENDITILSSMAFYINLVCETRLLFVSHTMHLFSVKVLW